MGASSGTWKRRLNPRLSLGSLLALRHLSAGTVICRRVSLMPVPTPTAPLNLELDGIQESYLACLTRTERYRG